jgi:hypothetical protein
MRKRQDKTESVVLKCELCCVSLQVRLAWERLLQPEEEDMQMYASWKYFR